VGSDSLMPNLPPGFEIEDRGDYDPLAPLLQAGVEPTNGYRTKGDIQRLKAEGYTPATNSDHLRGDAVDLTPGKSGWNLTKLAAKAKEVFGPEAQVGIHNGTHVHVSLKGWGQAPGTPGTKYSGLPDVPEGFEVEQRGSLKGANYGSSKLPAVPEGFEVEQPHAADAAPHDGDTFKLDNGRSARLFGVDAYELHQQGRRPDQSLEPLGIEARDFLGRHPPQNIELTGQSSYGRSVVADDPASLGLLRNGYALAEPHYLEGDSRFPSYMEAERLARLNRLGGHGTNAETPAQFRHHDGPWKSAEPGKYGQGEAVFWDDPTPFQGLRDDVAKGYLSIWQDMKSKPEDLLAYAKDNGFKISESDTRKAYATATRLGMAMRSCLTRVRPAC
jgi:endonuclease YncB( thermonuclease family)